MKLDFRAIKEQNPIEEFIGRTVHLRPQGKSLIGLCPFHDDHNPSLTVDPRRQTFKCWSCGASGDVIDFMSRQEAISTVEAAQRLGGTRASHPFATRSSPPMIVKYQPPVHSWQVAAWAEVQRAERRLDSLNGRNGSGYLERRGLTLRTAQSARVGYKPDAWDPQAGKSRPALVIPHIDGKGIIMAVKYRFVDEIAPSRYSALKCSRPLIFGLDQLKQPAPPALLIVEGELNALSLHQVTRVSGIDIVSPGSQSASLATGYLNGLIRLRRYQTVLVWMDEPERATDLISKLKGPRCHPVRNKEGRDANAILTSEGSGALKAWING